VSFRRAVPWAYEGPGPLHETGKEKRAYKMYK